LLAAAADPHLVAQVRTAVAVVDLPEMVRVQPSQTVQVAAEHSSVVALQLQRHHFARSHQLLDAHNMADLALDIHQQIMKAVAVAVAVYSAAAAVIAMAQTPTAVAVADLDS
jgi:ABC-type antimicrobial peptide transport system permease subunit